MAEGVDFGYDDRGFDDGNEDVDETTPFIPNSASTPANSQRQQEMPMGSIKETDFSDDALNSYLKKKKELIDQNKKIDFDELSRRFFQLKRNGTTGLIDTEQIPNVENPLGYEEREKEIQRVRDFITASYPEFDESKLVISFSSGKKPMDIVVKGPKGGETKIIKDNGSGFQIAFS